MAERPVRLRKANPRRLKGRLPESVYLRDKASVSGTLRLPDYARRIFLWLTRPTETKLKTNAFLAHVISGNFLALNPATSANSFGIARKNPFEFARNESKTSSLATR